MNEENKKAVLVGANVLDEPYFDESMEELCNLAAANYYEVTSVIKQNLKGVNRAFYIGTGKIEEVKQTLIADNADIVIFNNELSPAQLKNLEKLLNVQILDRTSLILQIFADRAKTREAKLQVAVASLKYMLPRLRGLHEALGRQGGMAGASNRGLGEKKIELDRRRIEDKLADYEKELKELENTRGEQRKKRDKSEIPKVALVGYTNAGKSTVMNSMVEKFSLDQNKKVFEKDLLFATLETYIRNITLPDNKEFLLFDTVGFIRELPHGLVKAFRSTLEEIKRADLLVHVIDFSDENYAEQKRVTEETLKGIGASDIPTIYVYNKCDKVMEDVLRVEENSIYMAAGKRIGIDELIELIKKEIYSSYVTCQMLVPYKDGGVLSYLTDNSTILSTNYLEAGTLIEVELKLALYNKYKEYEVNVCEE